MKVQRLTIQRFRGIKEAMFHFDGHTLLIGANNVGKSTVCEALDLVLGPDRLNRFPAVQEFDFYNAEYLSADGETPIPAKIEIILTELTSEIERACPTHLEFWYPGEQRLLVEGEADLANFPNAVRCLRLQTVALYNKDEDEFEAKTYFCHGTSNFDDSPEQVRRNTKRLFGFLYLRALRTGSRALSLERGSLLDIILRLQGIKTGLWENSIKRLRELDPPIAQEAVELAPVLETIEKRLAEYIHLNSQEPATRLFVSNLTREHLRETISFFLSTAPDQKPVPFKEAGTGTLNTLVLALLSFIADVKKDNVIFAMEEPEIALPPHTQRRIAKYLLTDTSQCFVTTHSPYVIEQFDADRIQILSRDDNGAVKATKATVDGTLKGRLYRRHIRRGLAEAMLGRAVIVAEGISEQAAIKAISEKMQSSDPNNYPLDLSGVTIFPVEGDGSMAAFGGFFKSLGLRTYAFYDKKVRTPEDAQRLSSNFDDLNETAYSGIEQLLVTEMPVQRQWQLLESLRQCGIGAHLGIPAARPSDDKIKELLKGILKSNKGDSYAEDLINLCAVEELPTSISAFLSKVFADYPTPKRVPVPSPTIITEAKASSVSGQAPSSGED